MSSRSVMAATIGLMSASQLCADPSQAPSAAVHAARGLLEVCTLSVAAGSLFAVFTVGLMGLALVIVARPRGGDELRQLATSVETSPGRTLLTGLAASIVALFLSAVLGHSGFGLLGLLVLGAASYGAAAGLASRALCIGEALVPGHSSALQLAVGCPLLTAAGLFPVAGQILLAKSALQGLGAWCAGPASRCVAAGRAAVAAASGPASPADTKPVL